MILRRFYFLAGCIALLAATVNLHAHAVRIGVVNPATERTLSLSFKNTGTAPLVLGELKSSCGCLEAIEVPASVKPGETVEIPCVFQSPKPGSIAVVLSLTAKESGGVLQTFEVSGFVADPAWFVTVDETAERLKAGTVRLVDTRTATRFAEAHISQSINLLPFALRARTDLRSQPVVLVDDGFAPAVLLAERERLIQKGFSDVRILSGGLPAWMRGGQLVEGTFTAVAHSASISAADQARLGLADMAVIDWAGAESVKAIEAALAASQSSLRPVLVVADQDARYAEVEKRFGKTAGMAPLYYMTGGRPAWVAFQAEQKALLANSGQLFQTKTDRPAAYGTTSGCGSCSK